jgi:RNA polymerase subunit RPABC4/transcription elongation factor Spt4
MQLSSIQGLVTVTFVRAQALDVPVAEIPSFLEMLDLANALARYWDMASKGALQLAVYGYPPTVQLTQTAAKLAPMSRWDIGTAIIQAAQPEADLGSSDIFVGLVNTPCGGGAQGNRVVAGVYQELGQRSWRWCAKCQSLGFWDQSRSPGPCAAGGIHDHSSSGYYVARQQPPGEAGWRWCHKCECLARPTGAPAPCPGGGGHDFSGSGDYLAPTASTPATQSSWSYCRKCTVLIYSGGASGACPAGGIHAPSGTYFVGFDQFPALGFLSHETGHTLGLDHSFNDNPKPLDPSDDGRPGAYGDRWDIMSYSNTDSYSSAQFLTAGPMLAAPTVVKNDWVSPARVWSDTNQTAAEIDLVSTSEAITDGYVCGVVGVPHLGRVYSIEYRTPMDWDRAIPGAGVLIREHKAVADTPSLGLLAQNGWKWCVRCDSLVFRGHRACGHGNEHTSDGSQLQISIGSPPDGITSQSGWRWCSRCQALVQEESGAGVCAAGGGHDTSSSGAYFVVRSDASRPQTQQWFWCQNCKALVLYDPDGGRCPTGRQHNTSTSGQYDVLPSVAAGQGQWTNCGRCRAVYFDGVGACPAGGSHDTTESGDYFLVHDLDWAPGQKGWRWCAKCYGLGYLDPQRGPGTCAAGGQHDHSSSGAYSVEFVQPHDPSIPQPLIDQVEQTGWAWCRNCEMLGYRPKPSRCPAGGQHDFSQSGPYRLRFSVNGTGDEGHLQQSRAWGVGEQFVCPDPAGASGDLAVDVVAFNTQPSRATVRIHFF